MRRKKKLVKSDNLHVLVFFASFVAILLVGSLLLKFFHLLQTSRYDGAHRFTIAVGNEEGTKVQAISFAPSHASVSVLTVYGENLRLSSIGKDIMVPIDATVTIKQQGEVESLENTHRLLYRMVFSPKDFTTKLTFIDTLRLWLFAKGIGFQSVTTRELTLPAHDAIIDNLSYALFSDDALLSENLGITIINATGEYGLGNRMARLVANTGGNIVSVSTAATVAPKSEISYEGEYSYTVQRLSNILDIAKVKMQSNGISDIIITIGKDKASDSNF